jgi:Na+/H+-dicarboxylate symporter
MLLDVTLANVGVPGVPGALAPAAVVTLVGVAQFPLPTELVAPTRYQYAVDELRPESVQLIVGSATAPQPVTAVQGPLALVPRCTA